MEIKGLRQYDLNKYCAVLAAEFPLPKNSTQWLDSLRRNELGALLLVSLTTARRRLREKGLSKV
jgi:hypothetical protein